LKIRFTFFYFLLASHLVLHYYTSQVIDFPLSTLEIHDLIKEKPMIQAKRSQKRKGSVLVEYALLIAGVALVAVVAVAVLGHKVADNIGVMAAVLPSAHADDNKPIQSSDMIPINKDGDTLVLDSANLANTAGVDRMQSVLGAGNGELLIKD
jgi:pilus assembly protein Flp/PilA